MFVSDLTVLVRNMVPYTIWHYIMHRSIIIDFKLKEGRLRWVIRKLFITRVMKYWNRLPRGVVDATHHSLFIDIQVRLDSGQPDRAVEVHCTGVGPDGL